MTKGEGVHMSCPEKAADVCGGAKEWHSIYMCVTQCLRRDRALILAGPEITRSLRRVKGR